MAHLPLLAALLQDKPGNAAKTDARGRQRQHYPLSPRLGEGDGPLLMLSSASRCARRGAQELATGGARCFARFAACWESGTGWSTPRGSGRSRVML